jgi:hypothetical protein
LAGGSTPLVFVTGFNYELQKHGGNNKLLNLATGGWIVGGLLRYSSGAVLGIPVSANPLELLSDRPACSVGP